MEKEKQRKNRRNNKAYSENYFSSLDQKGEGSIQKNVIVETLASSGYSLNNPLVKKIHETLSQFTDEDQIDADQLHTIIQPNVTLFEKILQRNLMIPNFTEFCQEIETIYNTTKKITVGNVADYIPQLKRVEPEKYGLSICTVDGQCFSLGDATDPFVVQSTCKPISYCLALEEHGEEQVHQFVGREPSGRGFNELTLNKDGLPHNPMINAGAIMCSALIRPDIDVAERFEEVLTFWQKLCGGVRPGFSNGVYLSEKQSGDRNYALGYFMKEKKAFPPNTDLIQTLEFYFQCCSIEVTCEQMATIAATLANSGVCPLTEEKVLKPSTVKNCLSLMYSCGMYDFSGEYAFSVGIPAKSGVSGALMIVIPHVMGIALWSPRLDEMGNTVRGLEFSKQLVQKFNFHNYDSMDVYNNKIDPRLQKYEKKIDGVMSLCWAASQGDVTEIKRFVASGVDLNEADYDGRTPLHLACSEGHLNVVEYLLNRKVKLNPVDRWGGTPLDDAIRGEHKEVIKLLESKTKTKKSRN